MIKIMIIDDDDFWVKQIKSLLIQYQFELNINFEIVCGYNYSDYLMHNKDIDLFLLDMEIGEDSGLRIANDVSENNKEALVVYITSHNNYMQSAFGINVYKYILKNNLSELKNVLIFCKQHFSIKGMKIRTPYGLQFVHFKNIIYIESFYKKIYIYTKSDEIRVYATSLSHIITGLPHNFVMVNKQVVVNLDKIKNFNRDVLILSNGTQVHISRRRQKIVKDLYIERIMQ